MAKDKTKGLLSSEEAEQRYAARPAIARRGEIKPTGFKFNMGDEVRDTVTGLEGVIVGREDCITGCDRMHVQPKSKDGKDMPNGYMIDQDRLDLLVEIDAPLFEVVKAGAPAAARSMEQR